MDGIPALRGCTVQILYDFTVTIYLQYSGNSRLPTPICVSNFSFDDAYQDTDFPIFPSLFCSKFFSRLFFGCMDGRACIARDFPFFCQAPWGMIIRWMVRLALKGGCYGNEIQTKLHERARGWSIMELNKWLKMIMAMKSS